MELTPQIMVNIGTLVLAGGIAWGAARMGARYEGKLLRETVSRVDVHDEELEALRISGAKVDGVLHGQYGLMDRVESLAIEQAKVRADVGAIRTDIAVILTLLKQDRQ